MRWKIRLCRKCGEYTLRNECTHCGVETFTPHPPRFSPDDKYLLYRLSDQGNR